jgi:starch-binding outer membrane protein, SusD/RagB family
MKKLLYISTAILGFSFLSCKKELNLAPYNALPPSEVFSSDADFQNAVSGMYLEMRNSGAYYVGGDNSSFIGTNDILTDNLIGFSNSRGTGSQFADWNYNALTTTNFYIDGYAIIRSANEIIANIGNLPESDSVNKNDYLGQALAVRAVVHFDLVRLFGNAYNFAAATDLGVPYVTHVPAYTENPTRDIVKNNYDSVMVDLNNAASLIGDDAPGRLGKAAVYGYLSRLYLDMSDWPNTIASATASLNIESDPGSLTDFPNIWIDQTENGVLFKLKILQTDQLTPGTSFGQGAKAEQIPTAYLFNLYQSNDVRLTSYFEPVTYNGLNINLIIKYLGQGAAGDIQNLVDIKLLRVAEVYLNRAEAYATNGQDALALADLDALRSNRYANFSSGNETGAALKTAIALERRLELAMEGDRFVDLKRKGLGIIRPDMFGGLASALVRPWPAQSLVMSPGDHRFALPIDQNSINASKGVVLQNPGY